MIAMTLRMAPCLRRQLRPEESLVTREATPSEDFGEGESDDVDEDFETWYENDEEEDDESDCEVEDE
jgi:hypothetical protein